VVSKGEALVTGSVLGAGNCWPWHAQTATRILQDLKLSCGYITMWSVALLTGCDGSYTAECPFWMAVVVLEN
jgi:hypothetical protein